MGLFEIIQGLLIETRVIDTKDLPSQGVFYKDDFNIKIKKADIGDIIEYEHKFNKNDLLSSIECIKNVVANTTIMSKGYTCDDIKSVDIIFVFLEIVKFTTGRDLLVPYINGEGNECFITFDTEHFKYYDFSQIEKYYDYETREYVVDDYRFSLPSIGVESSLTNYLFSKSASDEITKLNKMSYDFMYFLGYKTSLTFYEIDNLIQIFNFDLDECEIKRVSAIVNMFSGIVSYTLLDGNITIDIKSKLNLQDIWKP